MNRRFEDYPNQRWTPTDRLAVKVFVAIIGVMLLYSFQMDSLLALGLATTIAPTAVVAYFLGRVAGIEQATGDDR